jgi:hypothetical protein
VATSDARSGFASGSAPGLILGLLLALASAVVPNLDSSSTPPVVVEPPAAPTAGATDTSTADVEAMLLQLTEAPEGTRFGYSRDRFKHWIDADGDGCDTRQEVLIEESLVPATSEETRCFTIAGQWLSLYDDRTFLVPGGLDIDHMVPLAEAWESGAAGWDDTRRQDYANDLGHPEALIAVSLSSNRSKGDRDPAEWKPPHTGVWCHYAKDWVTVKFAWGLSADEAEVSALRDLLATC